MTEHGISPASKEEIEALLDRLIGLRDTFVTADGWRSLFSSAELLIPRSNGNLITAADLDLPEFGRTISGKVIAALTSSFATASTFLLASKMALRVRADFMDHFYGLAPYVLPTPSLPYLYELFIEIRQATYEDGLYTTSKLGRYAPIVVKQIVPPVRIAMWCSELRAGVEELVNKGRELEAVYEDGPETLDPDEYSDWHSSSEDLIATANQFYSASEHEFPDNVKTLESLVDSVPCPPEDNEPEEEYYKERESDSEYWTIERMFEDL